MTLAKVLNDEFLARQKRNPKYSLRAFARDLKLDASNLSKLMNGKRIPTDSNIQRLKRSVEKSDPTLHTKLSQVMTRKPGGFFDVKPNPNFEQLLQWENICVLETLKLRPEAFTVPDLIQKTGLSEEVVLQALAVLGDSGLVQKKGQKYSPLYTHLATGGDEVRRTQAFNAYQKQLLSLAILATETVDPAHRSQTSMVFSLKKSRIEGIHKKITALRRAILRALDAGPSENDEVYALCVSLFPLTKLQTRE